VTWFIIKKLDNDSHHTIAAILVQISIEIAYNTIVDTIIMCFKSVIQIVLMVRKSFICPISCLQVSSWRVGGDMQGKRSRVWFFILIALVAIHSLAAGSRSSAQTYTPVPGAVTPWWEDRAGNSNVHFATAYDACFHQWQTFSAGYGTTFEGADSGGSIAGCHWTSGGPNPVAVYLTCPPDTRLPDGYCIRQQEHAAHCDCPAQGGANPSDSPIVLKGNPIAASDGAKVEMLSDYETADGLFRVDRFYRSSRGRDYGTLSTVRVPGFGEYWHGIIPGILVTVNNGGKTSDFEYRTATSGVIRFTIYDYNNLNNYTFASTQSTKMQMSMVTTPTEDRITYFNEAAVTNGPGEVRLDAGDGSYILFRRVDISTDHRTLVPVEQGFTDGHKLFFDYPASGPYPNRVRDSFGRQMTLTWVNPVYADLSGPFPDQVVSNVQLPDGTNLSYTYGNGGPPGAVLRNNRLEHVRRLKSDGTLLWARNYLYEDARFVYALTGQTDQNGQRLETYSYNDAGLAVSTELAAGVNHYQLSYSEALPDLDYFKSTVQNPLGLTTAYTYYRKSWFDFVPSLLIDKSSVATPTIPATSETYSYYNYNSYNFGLNSKTDGNGNLTSFVPDQPNNRPTQIVEAAGTAAARNTNIVWDTTRDLPLSETLTNSRVDYTYSPSGQLLTRTQTDTTTQTVPYSTANQARTWTYTWTAAGKVASIDGPKAPVGSLNDKVTYAYDTAGNVTSATNGLNQATTFAGYDGNGRPSTMTDPNAIVTAFVYDDLGRTSSITVRHPTTSALNATTSFDYDIEGRVIGITRPATEKLIVDYDLAGRVTAIRTTSGDRIDYALNAMGGVLSETVTSAASAIRSTITRTFDELNRVLSLTLGPSRTTSWSYDKNDNAVQTVSPRSNAATMAFDGLDRLVSTIAPSAGTVTDTYDVRDKPVSHTDAIAVTTSYVRDGFGEVIQETSPDRGTTVYYYDAAGDVVGRTDGRGQRVNYTRDMLGRVLTRVPVGITGQNITYSWDAGGITGGYGIGRLAKVLDPSGTTSFQYDHRGNMTIKRQKIGTTTSANLAYAYDLADRIVTVTYPSGRIVNYVRDGRGRVTSVTTKSSSTAAAVTLASSIAYEPFGTLLSLNYGNTLKLVNDWGSDARLVSRTVRRVSDNGVVWGASYGYDAEDNVTQVTDLTDTSRQVNYLYDAASRLTRATGTYGTVQQYDYAFDANGNRTRVETRNVAGSPSPTTATDYALVAGSNRLATLSGSEARTLNYDGRGNISGEVRGSATANLTYDAHGRLTGYARTGETTQANVYNGLEDRVQVTRTSGTADVRNYLYDGTGRLIGDYGTSATDVKGEFVWLVPEAANDNDSSGLQGNMDDGAGGWMPLAVMTGSGASTVIRYLHGDRLGMPVATTDTTGVITTPGTYAELQFPGQIKTLSDVYYNRWRDYDPGTGRYVQADPIGLAGGGNIYLYAGNNPIRFADPKGLTAWAMPVGLGAAGAGAAEGGEGGSILGPAGAAAGAIGGAIIGYEIYNHCHNNDCKPLYDQITTFRNDLAKRLQEYRQDIHQLPMHGTMSRAGHIEQIKNRQKGLRRLIHQADAKGCKNYEPDAWYFATMIVDGRF
jgi:RHS repeat-associated protein